MSTYDPDKYLPTIDAILGVADLDEITVKKIRKALQELFGIDLTPHKKDINDVILNRYHNLKHESDKKEREEMERQDALLAAKLSREESNGARGSRTKRKASSASGPSKTKRAAHNKNNSDGNRINSSNNNNPFNREMALSADLQRVIGEEMCSRPQVVKKLWAYIKENDLQNPSDKRQIMCDEKLQQLFKKKTVGAFEMNRILSKHIFKPDEIGESGESGANAPEPQKSSDVDDDEEDLEKDAQQLEDEISEAEY